MTKLHDGPRGFTLLEVAAVLVVLLILSVLVISRLGNVRSGAGQAAAARMVREFNRGVEYSNANGGSVLSDIQGYVSAHPTMKGAELTSDPAYMGSHTITYHLSRVSSPQPSNLKQLFTYVASAEVGCVLPDEALLADLLRAVNADLVVCYNGSQAQSVFLSLSVP